MRFDRTNTERKRKVIAGILLTIAIIFGSMNLKYYITTDRYIWSAEYRSDNIILADYVKSEYPDAILGCNYTVRGYLNLLFDENIYEYAKMTDVMKIALSKGKSYAIQINVEPKEWNLYRITDVRIADLGRMKEARAFVEDGEIVIDTNLLAEYKLASLTDENWTNGCNNFDNILLFEWNPFILKELETNSSILCGEERYTILGYDHDDLWIRVAVDRDADLCMYPAVITFE